MRTVYWVVLPYASLPHASQAVAPTTASAELPYNSWQVLLTSA